MRPVINAIVFLRNSESFGDKIGSKLTLFSLGSEDLDFCQFAAENFNQIKFSINFGRISKDFNV